MYCDTKPARPRTEPVTSGVRAREGEGGEEGVATTVPRWVFGGFFFGGGGGVGFLLFFFGGGGGGVCLFFVTLCMFSLLRKRERERQKQREKGGGGGEQKQREPETEVETGSDREGGRRGPAGPGRSKRGLSHWYHSTREAAGTDARVSRPLGLSARPPRPLDVGRGLPPPRPLC